MRKVKSHEVVIIINDLRQKLPEISTELEDCEGFKKRHATKQEAVKEEIKFLEMNLIYGHKCRKTIFKNLYKVGTDKYRECVLNKGPKK